MKLRRRGWLVIGLLSLSVGVVLAQEQASPEPMGRTEFVTLVNEKAPIPDIIEQVRARGISFQITEDLEAALAKLEGGQELLDALREPAAVELHANVAGAEVTVDGVVRDPIPAEGVLTLSGLAPGVHLIRLQAEGFIMDRAEVFLKPGETRRMEFKLESAVSASPGPLGMDVNVRAGTPEDSALAGLEFAQEPAERLQKLDELIERFADSPVLLLAHAQAQAAHIQLNQFDAALAAGEKVLAQDPENFRARVGQARAYLGKGDLKQAFEFTALAREQFEQARDAAPPEGVTPDMWSRLLEGAQNQLTGLTYDLFVGASQAASPAEQSTYLQRFLELFPNSDYQQSAYVSLAYAAQQQGQAGKAVEWADRALEGNPNEASMIVLVADALSEQGRELGRAQELTTHLLEMLDADPSPARPEGLSDEQWGSFEQLWRGMAHTIRGQILLHQETAGSPAGMNKTRRAAEEFRTASPLLQPQPQLYARNLFRLGFAYAKLGELVPARDTLYDVIKLQTVYSQPARDILDKVEQGLQRRKQ